MARPNIAGYVFESKVGSGTFADVYKASKTSHVRLLKNHNYLKVLVCFVSLQIGSKQIVAIKCISKKKLSSTAVDNIITEIKLLKLLKHPHIVEMLDFQWDER